MSQAGGTSLRRKVMVVVLATTCVALLLSATALLIYELRSTQKSWIDDLNMQARIIAQTSVAALTFDDPQPVAENLALLQLRPQIMAAAVYRSDRMFARYVNPGAGDQTLPARPGPEGVVIGNDTMEVVQPIREGDQIIGNVYLRSRFDIIGRLIDYLLILVAVMLPSLLVAALVSRRLQDSATGPILQVAQVARDVMVRPDFSLRAAKTSNDEASVLVDAFNNMLDEVARRTEALEQSNNHLSAEMAERRRAEEALRAAARTKDQFLATLAHELRNPLAPITNAVEILRRGGQAANPIQQRALEIMARQVQQMVRLIDDLLDVSRITTGKVLLDLGRVDLIAVLRSAVEIALPGIEARHHELALDLPPGPLFVHGDATRLAQVFANLLNNAAKYTDEGGHIAVRLGETADEISVHVSDSGVGIAPDKQDSIFDMFVQVDQSLERGNKGLGVGLTLARQLIELHGGHISVHSDGLGEGSEFAVRLPRRELPPPRPEPPAPLATPVPTHRVLIADDNVDFANSLLSILESLGQDVTVVHDGFAALEAASRLMPEYIFLDIGMPGMNGYEVAERLRRQPATCDAVIVAITGWGQEKDRERAREAGFDQHLVKPVDVENLVTLLRQRQPVMT